MFHGQPLPNSCSRSVDFQLVGLKAAAAMMAITANPPPSQLHCHQQQCPAQASATSWTKPLTHLAPAVCPRGKAQHRPRTNSRKKREKMRKHWEKNARERIVMKGTARGRDERLRAEDLYVEELGVKERRARVLCATCTCGRAKTWKMALGNIPFGSTSNVTTDCAERQETNGLQQWREEAGVELWEGIHPRRRAARQRRHRLPSWQEVGELEELGKALLDLPILVVGESLGEFGKA